MVTSRAGRGAWRVSADGSERIEAEVLAAPGAPGGGVDDDVLELRALRYGTPGRG